MSELKQAAADLMTVTQLLDRMVCMPKNPRNCPPRVLALCQHLRNLQSSLGRAQSFIATQANLYDLNEKKAQLAEETLRNQNHENKLNHETLLFLQKSVSREFGLLAQRQEEFKKRMALVVLEEKRVMEKDKKLYSLYKELVHREKKVKERMEEIKKATEVNNKNVKILDNGFKTTSECSKTREKVGQAVDNHDLGTETSRSVGNEVSEDEKVKEGKEETLESRRKRAKEGRVDDDDVVLTTSNGVCTEGSEEGRKRRKTADGFENGVDDGRQGRSYRAVA